MFLMIPIYGTFTLIEKRKLKLYVNAVIFSVMPKFVCCFLGKFYRPRPLLEKDQSNKVVIVDALIPFFQQRLLFMSFCF